jgi:hypothetical protein
MSRLSLNLQSSLPATFLAMGACFFALELLAPERALAQGCAPLTLSDTQDGFAGETGTVWTVTPDCSLTVARRTGPNVADPHGRRLLTAEQQERLKAALAQTAIASLPAQLGGGPRVNARRIAISYEGKVSVLTLAPGGGLQALYAASEGPARQLLELAVVLESMTPEPEDR